MPYVITAACLDVQDGSCLKVCPVDCIYTHPDERQYFIHPTECIDCGSCEMVCPVQAIFRLPDVPATQQDYIEINRAFFDQHPDYRDHHSPSWK
ncbi:MAG: ferredoxin [Candidatus Melainabacteria bacterium HGW-Melainabacteria-1]|nr:MAG: ferredoxin [Candidatus Melainabacteria bacterium HGW-Melainabacteria-1]